MQNWNTLGVNQGFPVISFDSPRPANDAFNDRVNPSCFGVFRTAYQCGQYRWQQSELSPPAIRVQRSAAAL